MESAIRKKGFFEEGSEVICAVCGEKSFEDESIVICPCCGNSVGQKQLIKFKNKKKNEL